LRRENFLFLEVSPLFFTSFFLHIEKEKENGEARERVYHGKSRRGLAVERRGEEKVESFCSFWPWVLYCLLLLKSQRKGLVSFSCFVYTASRERENCNFSPREKY
jgi:hypothetical protein